VSATTEHPGALERMLLDQASEMLLAVDPATLTIAAANQAAVTLLGYAREDLLGRLITDIESALSDVFYWEEVRRGASGEVRDVEGLYRCGDDSLLPVVKDVRRAATDGREWLVLRVRDERRRLRGEESLARMSSQLKATLEATGDGILVIDAEGRIVNMNRSFGAMWDIPDQVLHGGDDAITAWLEGRLLDPEAYRRGITEAACDGQGESFDILALADGRFFERRARPQILGERVVGRVYNFHDITERVRNERDLIELRDRAEQASLAKGRFLAVMSHEVRTPMNGILGMAQLLMHPDLSEAERIEYARTVFQSGQTLLALLNDILDLSKIEAGKLDLARNPFEPWLLIDELTALFSGAARAKGIEIVAHWRGPGGRRYWGDALRLRQVLSNLIGNAVKFTEHGFVRVEAAETCLCDGTAQLEFSVTDSGIGIPADKQSLLFHPFSQVDASNTREYGGTGLGLSIVQNLVTLMSGETGVESEVGRGARFWFRIPAAVVQEVAPAFTARLEADDRNRTDAAGARAIEFGGMAGDILVVEDNATNRHVIETLLGKLGLTVRCAANGQEGFEAFVLAPPSLVLMDCQMPMMDGFEATEKIRRWEGERGRPRVPVVALTAGVFPEDRARCAAAGMDDFLPKPVHFNALAEMLGRWLVPAQEDAGPYDVATMLELLGGDRRLARSMTLSALEDLPGYFDRLDQAILDGDWSDAERTTHSLKGLTAQIGGNAIVARMGEMNRRLRHGGQATPQEARALREEYEAMAAILRAWVDGTREGEPNAE
jgi:PAS domain S-box-containing protein